MELFTTELTKSKKLSEKLTKTCELLQTEVNLLNKLLFLEQKFSDHLLNDLFVLYDKNLADIQQNYRYFETWNQLQKQRSVAKQNEIQVKRLRHELKSWRQNNNRLNNDVQKTDHTYSTGTDAMTVVNDKSLKTEILTTSSQSGVSSVTQTSTIVPKVRHEVKNGSLSIKLEVIPKSEPEDCLVCEDVVNVSEDTDSASEKGSDSDNDCIVEGVEPTPNSPKSTQPFVFVSEYLYKNKAFSHLLDTNKEHSKEDKAIAIDLNSDSDSEDRGVSPKSVEQPVPKLNSIFSEQIVDLTPKAPTLKKSPEKSFIKKRVRFGKKKKILRSAQKNKEMVELNILGTSISDSPTDKGHKRVIGSNRKKIHFNADNTISIFEVRTSPVKKSSKTEDKLISSPVKKGSKAEDTVISNTALNPMSRLSRSEKAKDNENYIKANKKIVLKGKTYYCRWKNCSYSTVTRSVAVRHMWKHTGEKPFKCQHCSEGFRDKRNLITHMTTHKDINTGVYNKRGTGDFICPVCKGRFHHFPHLMRHMRRQHTKEMADKYKELYYKQNHMQRRDKSPVVDKQKTPSSKDKSNRNSIDKIPKTTPDSSLKPISPKKFYKNLEFTKQLIENSQIPETEATEGETDYNNEWKCDFKSCLRSYSLKSNLKRHQMEIHKKVSKPLFYGTIKTKEVKYFIPKMAENSPKKTKLIKNPTLPPSEGTANKVFSCNFKNCPKGFQTIGGLYKHKKNVHMFKTERSVPQKSTKFKNSKSVHKTTERSPKKNRYTVGMEGTFICPEPECGSRFVWNKNLKAHLKEKHNNSALTPELAIEEPSDEVFECTYPNCPFTANSRHTQVIHYKTHFSSEDKPFKCLITGCDYSSQKLSLLKYHVLNRHSEQQFFRAMEESGVQYPSWY